MRFICDNSYFLEGMKEYINPGKFIISGMQTDNVVIISSSGYLKLSVFCIRII